MIDSLATVAVAVLWGVFAWCVVGLIVDMRNDYLERRRARLERELDDTQERLRAALMMLASEMHRGASEARLAMIRESFIAAQADKEPPESRQR